MVNEMAFAGPKMCTFARVTGYRRPSPDVMIFNPCSGRLCRRPTARIGVGKRFNVPGNQIFFAPGPTLDDERTARKRVFGLSAAKLKARNWLFIATVVVPTFIAILYYGFFASDIYVSESKFVVRSPDKPAATGLGVILKSAGFANAGDELYAAQSFAAHVTRYAPSTETRNSERRTRGPTFLFSTDLIRSICLVLSKACTIISKRRSSCRIDPSTSITTLTVRAYDPKDAYRFNEQLLEMSGSDS